MSLNVIKAAISEQELLDVERLAKLIWSEHYTPIIGAEQVAYMLDKFQSFPAMQQQIAKGMQYFQLLHDGDLAGYMAVELRVPRLFLSKIYIDKNYRGKGLGKLLLNHAENLAQKQSCEAIELTVNKYNTNTIEAYKAMQFAVIDEVVMDIGAGYVMDDFVMRKSL